MPSTRSGMTNWNRASFDNKFSERNVPLGSERSVMSVQNSVSVRRDGSPVVAAATDAPRPTQTASSGTASRRRQDAFVTPVV